MSDNEAMTKLLEGIKATDRLLGRAERIGSVVKWLLGGAVLCVLWVARVEWGHQDHENRIAVVEADSKAITRDVDRMKGSLGITKSTPPKSTPPPPAYVWKPEDECTEEEQATH
mgnify:CR=1 FL=1